MALVERVMGVNDDGSIPSNGRPDKIPVHVLYAAMQEVGAGRLTAINFRSYFNIRTVVDASGKSDAQDLTAIIAAVPAAGTVGRALFLNHIHSIFLLAEAGYLGAAIPGYDTPANVRAKLGI